MSMPSAGYSHFYNKEEMCHERKKLGVNALGGLFSFLRVLKMYGDCSVNEGVNALGGLFSFLHWQV